MTKIIQFGEKVEGYNIPVLNEREIRAAAGILFLATFTSWIISLLQDNFVPIKYVITFFLIDFLIRVFINPRFSPTLIFARWIVRNQTPEYVGAAQKKFAWIIGVVLATTMFIHFVILNVYSFFTGLICLACLAFLFFEAVFGICLGCKLYHLFFKDKVQYCPGEVCDVNSKHEIQKISKGQSFVLLAFIVFIFLTGYFMNARFSEQPYEIFRLDNAAQTK
jgi:hypothetical protein